MTDRAAIAGIALAIGSYGFAFGVLARSAGLGWVLVLAMSALAYSGGAQAAFVSALTVGSPATAFISGALVNLRLGIYGAIASRILRPKSTLHRLSGVHLAVDETIALTAGAEPDVKVSTYWTSGLAFFATWVISTVAGALTGSAIGDPRALGLDAAFPAVFVALLFPMLKTPASRRSAGAAAGATLLLVPLLPTGLPIVGAAVAAIASVALTDRVHKR